MAHDRHESMNRRGIYFCAATAFDRTLVESLEKKLQGAPAGSWVVTVHHAFNSTFREEAYQGVEALPFTWGWDNVYFYRVG